MSDTLLVPVLTNQKTLDLDYGYVGLAAVTEAQKTEKKNKDNNTLANARTAVRVTAGDLEKEFGKSRFKPETIDMFSDFDQAAPKTEVASQPAVDAPQPATVQKVALAEPEKAPEAVDHSKQVLFPFTEANLKSARPFADDKPRTNKILPVTSTAGREQERIRQAQELSNKPVVGLMRVIHTADGKMRRSQLADGHKIEAVAKKAAPNHEFDPWADMVRKRIAEQKNSSPSTEQEEAIVAAPRMSGPRP